MKFFNIRYECNDARDDYFKLLKEKNATGGVFPHWFNSDNNDHFDDDDDDDDDDGADFMVHEEYEADQYTSTWGSGPLLCMAGYSSSVNCSSSCPNFILTELIL